MSLDPDAPKYAYLSTYCFAANNPILMIDKGGKGPYPSTTRSSSKYLSQNGKTYLYLFDSDFFERPQGTYPALTFGVINIGYEMYEVHLINIPGSHSDIGPVPDYTYVGTGRYSASVCYDEDGNQVGEPSHVVSSFAPFNNVAKSLPHQNSLGLGFNTARQIADVGPLFDITGHTMTFGYASYMQSNFKKTIFPTGDFAYTGRYGQYLGLSFNETPSLNFGVSALKYGGRYFGYFGTALGAYGMGLDCADFYHGRLSNQRFAYRAIGFGAGTFGTFALGGPTATLIGASFTMGEAAYDGVNLFINEASKFSANFNNAVNSGWVPH